MTLDEMKEMPIWVCWKERGGRKIPYTPSGSPASSTDPGTWATYEQAAAAEGYDGVGLVITGGRVGIDIDGCVHAGEIEPWAREIVDRCGSYAEISPSGDGLHIIATGDAERLGAVGRANHKTGIEVYNHGRYFTFTGNNINDNDIIDATHAVAGVLAEHFKTRSGEQVAVSHMMQNARDNTRRMATDAMRENARRSGRKVRYARVYRGDACDFCVMLSSRGFVYYSEDTAGFHTHKGCDCVVVCSPAPRRHYTDAGGVVARDEGAQEVEGYDPDDLYARYQEMRAWDAAHPEADGKTRKEEHRRIIQG